MNREEFDRLLSEYATGGLTEAEKRELFAAAVKDQELFDQLMEEDSIRELVEMPGARNRLIHSLEEEEVNAVALAPAVLMERAAARKASAPVSPSPARWQQQRWLAWAAGIGVVLVSGAFTYLLFDRSMNYELASKSPGPAAERPEPKPFAPPPAATQPKPRPAKVEEPPQLPVAKETLRVSAPIVAPLPSSGPPAPPKPALVELAKRTDLPSTQQFRDATQAAAPLVPPSQQLMDRSRDSELDEAKRERAVAPAPRRAAPRAAEGVRVTAAEEALKTATPLSPPSIWRRTTEGIWVRIPPGDAVERDATLVLRAYAPTSQPLALTDDRGRVLQTRTGKAGDELEFPIPAGALRGASGAEIELYLRPALGAVGGGVVGGAAPARQSPGGFAAQTLGLRILLKLK